MKGYVSITDRDIDIFKTLSAGPATLEQLYRYHWKKNRNEFLHKENLRKRLSKLVNAGFLYKQRYNRTRITSGILYYLTRLSVEYLTVYCNYAAENIRMSIVSQEDMFKELIITEVVRVVKSDMMKRQMKYLIRDSRWFLSNTENGDGISPDLYIRIKDSNTERKYFVVVDIGSEVIRDVINRVQAIRGVVLIITLNKMRFDILKKTLLQVDDHALYIKTCFILLSELSSKGFFSCSWEKADGSPTDII
ncbi:MAG: hypothetical protein AB1488_06510 [Nitrospirota bacterium]